MSICEDAGRGEETLFSPQPPSNDRLASPPKASEDSDLPADLMKSAEILVLSSTSVSRYGARKNENECLARQTLTARKMKIMKYRRESLVDSEGWRNGLKSPNRQRMHKSEKEKSEGLKK